MSAAVLYMSMSLDGFIAGPNAGIGTGLGGGGAPARVGVPGWVSRVRSPGQAAGRQRPGL